MERKFTPEKIEELKEDEIFVFGSNMLGNHAGGAAKLAVERFGAIQGQAKGLQGKSYAIPTLDKDMKKCSLKSISDSIDTLYQFADENADLDFYVTKIGLGIAGFQEEEIANLFKSKEFTPFNIFLPMEFSLIKGVKGFNKNMTCRNMQFEENKNFHQDGEIKCCNNGIHFCEDPFDVKKYYPNNDENAFCEVEGFGRIDTHKDDSKISVSDIEIKGKINWLNVIKLGFNFTLRKATFLTKRAENKGYRISSRIIKSVEEKIKEKQNSNTLAGRNSNTLAGRDSNTLAGRDYNTLAGRNSNTLAGQDSNTLAGQNYNTLAGRNSNTLAGQDSNTLAGQNYNTLAGRDSNTLAGRDYNTLAGRDSNTLAGRDSNTLAGRDYNTLAGRNSNTLAGRDYNIIACRFNNVIEMNGVNNVSIAANNSKIKGKIGNAICLVEFDDKCNIRHVKSSIIDGKKLKEDVFYKLENGKFIEVE